MHAAVRYSVLTLIESTRFQAPRWWDMHLFVEQKVALNVDPSDDRIFYNLDASVDECGFCARAASIHRHRRDI